MIIREAQGQILVEMEFQPPDKVVVNRGRLLCNGVELLIRPKNILITNNATFYSETKHINVHAGLIIGRNPGVSGAIVIPKLSRYMGDRTEALKFEKETHRNKPKAQNHSS